MRRDYKKPVLVGCGALLFLCAAFICVIAVVMPTRILLAAVGFERDAETNAFLSQQALKQQPTPDWSGLQGDSLAGSEAPALQSAEGTQTERAAAPQTITVNVNGQTGVIDPNRIHAGRVEQGQTAEGAQTLYVEYDEAGATALVQDILINSAPELRDRISNPQVDLKPGAIVVYGDTDLEFGRQRVGMVLAFNETGTQFELAGIDIGGQLYSTPPDGYLGEMARLVEEQGNLALSTATIENGLRVQQIYISEDGLQIVASQ